MANKLSDEVQSLYQRTGTNAGRLRTEGERAAFVQNVKADIANIIYQYNVVIKPLVAALSSEEGLDALDFGLSGNVLFTHVSATAADAIAFYDTGLGRAHTVKETIDVLLSELARLENLIDNIGITTSYDDTSLRTLLGVTELDLDQLTKDTMGTNYVLDGDGLPNLSYSLSQAVDAIGLLFTGFPGTGNTYPGSYPALALAIALSDIVIDTTLPLGTIDDIEDYLASIRLFIGMGTVGPEMPTYSAHGTITTVTDGDSLEEAIQALDAAVETLSAGGGGGAGTLQESYDEGTTDAGTIVLTNAKGHIVIQDDSVSALNTVLEWQTGDATSLGELSNTGLWLKTNAAAIRIEEAAANPTAIAGSGFTVVRPGAGSTDAELFYQNDNAATSIAQITRDGIVKELEVGTDWFQPSALRQTTGVTRNALILGVSPDTDMEYDACQLQDINPASVFLTCSPPRDESGRYPTAVNVQVFTTPADNPTGGPFTYVLSLYSNDTGPAVAPEAVLLAPLAIVTPSAWLTKGDVISPSITFPADLYRVHLSEWNMTVGTGTATGLFLLKLTRATGHISDTLGADVSILGVRLTWYRG